MTQLTSTSLLIFFLSFTSFSQLEKADGNSVKETNTKTANSLRLTYDETFILERHHRDSAYNFMQNEKVKGEICLEPKKITITSFDKKPKIIYTIVVDRREEYKNGEDNVTVLKGHFKRSGELCSLIVVQNSDFYFRDVLLDFNSKKKRKAIQENRIAFPIMALENN